MACQQLAVEQMPLTDDKLPYALCSDVFDTLYMVLSLFATTARQELLSSDCRSVAVRAQWTIIGYFFVRGQIEPEYWIVAVDLLSTHT